MAMRESSQWLGKKYCVEYWLKEPQESTDRCSCRRYIPEILLNTALNTIQSINQSVSLNFANMIIVILFKERNVTLTCKCQKRMDDLATMSLNSCVLTTCAIF